MKLLTLNFLTCAIKSCKPLPAAFPLHIRDAELESVALDFNPLFLRNVMSRIEWPAMRTVLAEVGLALPPGVDGEGKTGKDPANAFMDVDEEGIDGVGEGEAATVPEQENTDAEVTDETLRKLHEVLMETQVVSGKLVCGNCGHEYAVREGIPNFLLPAHLV